MYSSRFYGNFRLREIVTSWRSGSTFFGQILQSHPGTFYHYEPLLHLGIRQARPVNGPGNIRASEALGVLKGLLECNYAQLGKGGIQRDI